MRKFHRNTLLALLMTLVLTFMALPITAKADISTEQVVDVYSGTVDGVERTLVSTSTDSGNKIYFKVGDSDFKVIYNFATQSVVDKNGTIWVLDTTSSSVYNLLLYWNYNLTPDMNSIIFLEYAFDVESIITKGSGSEVIGTGFKTSSGEIMPFPRFSTLKRLASVDIPSIDSSIPEPHYIPSSKTPVLPTPAVTATPIPVATETPLLPALTPIPVATTKTPVPTVEPTVTPKQKAAPLSIEKSKSKSIMYQGDTIISKLTLKKGTLTWNRQGKKTKRYKGVKDAALILKSKNAVFITKKGAAYTVSYKSGKKKRIVKKGAKKILCAKDSAVKIKMANRKIINIKYK